MIKNKEIYAVLLIFGLMSVHRKPAVAENWEQTITMTSFFNKFSENQTGIIDSQDKVEPYSWGMNIEFETQKWFDDKFRFTLDGGYKATFKEKPRDNGNSYDTSDFDAGIIELSLNNKITDNQFIEVGVLPCNFGNSLFLNPYNYLNHYVDDSSLYGAYSFPGIKYTIMTPSSSYSFLWLPCLTDPDNSRETTFLAELIQAGKTNNLTMLQGNYYLGKGRLSLALYAEEKEAWQFNDPYLGTGIEAQFPIYSNCIFNFQFLHSNGLARKGLQPVKGVPGIYEFGDIVGSENNGYSEIIATLGFNLFSLLDITLGYAFNERGITKQTMQIFSKGVAKMDGKSDPNYIAVMDSALDLGYSPLDYVRHLGLINLNISQISDYLSFNAASFISLDDGSVETNLFLEYIINDQTYVDFIGMRRFGDKNSIFGSAFKESSIGLQLKLVF